MMKKKLLGLFLTAALVLSLAACGSKPASTEEPASKTEEAKGEKSSASAEETGSTASADEATEEETEKEGTPVDGGQVIIGDGTQSNGDIYPYWSNNASDYAVYDLTFGYGTIISDKKGVFQIDPQVVTKHERIENADGTVTHKYNIAEDLVWSNGEPIKAKDFVFHVLYFSSGKLAEAGAEDSFAGLYYDGFNDFHDGKTKEFKGVRLLGDYEFSVTMAKDYLPNFYELAFAGVGPSYMKDWLPEGVDVADDGKGAYFTKDIDAKVIKDLVDKNRFNLSTYSGAYVKDKYDETSNTYTLKRNPKYKGTFDGQKPHIETIIYKYVQASTQLDELATGQVDILTGMMEADEINKGLDLVNKGTHGYYDYARNGYGRLVFICDRGPSQFLEVRRAVAYLLDRNEFAKTFTGGHGTVVNGPYGTSLWMVEEREEDIATLNSYNKSLDNAIAELEKGGWVLDKDGKEYKEGIRYKKLDDGTLMPLVLNWCSSEGNKVSDLLATNLANSPDVKKAGMEIKQTKVSFNELIENYTQAKENDFNMFNLGTGFTAVYNQETQYKIDGTANRNKLNDEQLAKLAKDMNIVAPDNKEEYLNRFIAFQKRWNELLPDIPLYSNQIHDFYSNKVKNYKDINDGIWSTNSQIIYCWVEE